LVAIAFLDSFHRPKLENRLAARFHRRQTGPKILGSLQSDMFFDLSLQPLFVLAGSY
jgi:hypothetical protein